MKALEIGLARQYITPQRGVALVGYFNPRPNTGALDELSVRVMLFRKNGVISGFINFDLCFITGEFMEEVRSMLREAGVPFADNLAFAATHTHTGPYVTRFLGADADAGYLDYLRKQTVRAVVDAYANMAPGELEFAEVEDNKLAFNRRYYMQDGKVLTNPGKLNPKIVRPEGPVDREVSVMAVRQDGRIAALAVNLVNHTDTIGGNFVSADWPGRMERTIQNCLGSDVMVSTFVGCSGNINHFDVSEPSAQTDYDEAKRIGQAYGKTVCALLGKLEKVPFDAITVKRLKFAIPFCTITPDRVEAAKAILAKVGDAQGTGDLTSEGLATGDGPVARFFAEQLIDYAATCSGKTRHFELMTMTFGDALTVATLPGEAFTEIGLAVKSEMKSAYKMVFTLTQGECGYIPMEECFRRGGYEILPVAGGSPREDTAPRIQSALIDMIRS